MPDPFFEPIDRAIIALYLAATVALGVWLGRGQRTRRQYVVAGRSLPAAAVGLSMLATVLNADDFVATPAASFVSDLSFLAFILGGLVATVLAAVFYLPHYYRADVLTVYEYLRGRFGPMSQRAAAGVFLAGKLISAGLGLMVASLPLVVFFGDAGGEVERGQMMIAVVGLGVFGTIYTAAGGIRAVVWTDVLQMAIVFAGAVYAIGLIVGEVPLSGGEMVDRLRDAAGGDKLTAFHWELDWQNPFSVWAIPAATLFYLAIFTSSHGMTQRLLACRDATRAGLGLVGGYLVGIVSVAIFLAIGLMAWLLAQPDVVGPDAATTGLFADPDGVYPSFVKAFFPPGLAGLAVAGLIAAVMSSFDSSVASVASSLRVDVLAGGDPEAERGAPWKTTLACGLVLTGMGLVAVGLYEASDDGLLETVLGLGSFPLGPLLGVFTCGVLTRRGTDRSAILALALGAATWLAMWWGSWTAFPWWLSAAAVVSFVTCAVPPGRR